MPLYEYQCEACGQRFEKIQKFSDPLADVCARCGRGPVQKLLSSSGTEAKESKDSTPTKESKESASTSTPAAGSAPTKAD
jgi:putative FmdB family regulatory protein